MSRAFRHAGLEDLATIDLAISRLREARHLLRGAGAAKAASYVGRALKSAEGAMRHATSAVARSSTRGRGGEEGRLTEGER
jgi:hypothetical protein